MLTIAAILLVLCGVVHSILGERYLLSRLFKRDNLPHLFGSDAFTTLERAGKQAQVADSQSIFNMKKGGFSNVAINTNTSRVVICGHRVSTSSE